MTPQPPIVVVEGAEPLLFESAQAAALKVEAIDVIAGEYRFFDALGRELTGRASSEYGHVEIFLAANAPTRAEELRSIVAASMIRIGPERFGRSREEIESAALDDLLATLMEFEKRLRDRPGALKRAWTHVKASLARIRRSR